MIIPGRRALVLALAALAAGAGAGVALHYHQLGLTLSHYDARAHLVVARRITDSITPGWQQIGAVWLPLPHLLNMLPVQIDLFYRTGLSAVAISIVSFAVAVGAIAWIVATITDSNLAATAAALVFVLNPNVLYLQSTPMTEPLLMALTLLAVAMLVKWCYVQTDGRSAALSSLDDARDDPEPVDGSGPRVTDENAVPARYVGLAFALACLTRYEAWPVTAAALTATIWVCWRGGVTWRSAATSVGHIAAYPAVAIAGFIVFSRIVGGAWFADDFFVPENTALGHPYESLAQIAWGVRSLSGYVLTTVAVGGLFGTAAVALSSRPRAAALVPLALVTTAAVPWLAFLDGHPYRIRYMLPLLAAEAVFAGAVVGLWKRARWVAAVGLVLVAAFELRPLDASAPMVIESQWDRPNIAARDRVSACLVENYHAETVMVSMGSLGHYMQDLSRSGFSLRDFLHEGNGDIWLNALVDPRPFVGWLLIEEQAEGGDMLAKRARENPDFLAGFSRVCEAAGVALYRRNPLVIEEDARQR